jgi:hypothetical protein
MPLIQGSTSIALSSVNDNVLTGSQFEFLPYNAVVEFGLNGDANGADLRVDVYSGQDVLMENAPMNTRAVIPTYPDDFLLNDVAAAGERIKVRARNVSAAAARTLYWVIRITPV